MNVVLIHRSGGDFGFQDVFLLGGKMNSFADVYCLSDRFTQPFALVTCQMLPMKYHWKGWWAKMNLFSPELEKFRPFLYVDLDTAILGDIRYFIPTKDTEQAFIMLRDFYRLSSPASGVMWIPNNNKKIEDIWGTWIASPEAHMRQFRGDQEFIKSVVSPDLFWQDIKSGIYSFKPSQRNWLNTIPEDALMVCFHGKPRIWEAANKVNWVYEYVGK